MVNPRQLAEAIIVVTDAAHLLASPALYRRVVDAVRAGADAAIPGLPLTEVVKEIAVTGSATAPVVEAGRNIPRNSPTDSEAAASGASWLRGAHELPANYTQVEAERVPAIISSAEDQRRVGVAN